MASGTATGPQGAAWRRVPGVIELFLGAGGSESAMSSCVGVVAMVLLAGFLWGALADELLYYLLQMHFAY